MSAMLLPYSRWLRHCVCGINRHFFFQSDIFLSFEFVVRMVVPSIYSSFIVCYFGSSAPESKRDSGKKTTAPVSKPTAADRYETIDITQMGTSIYSHYEV